MVDDIASEDFVTAYSSPSSSGTTYMMYGYKKGYTLNALWGFRYGGVWHNQEEVERNKITKAYASASGNHASSPDTPAIRTSTTTAR